MATARAMANLILCWNDAISETSGVEISSHSTEVSGYVAENLLNDDRQVTYKTSVTGGNTVHVEFNLGSAIGIKAMSIHNHNANTKGGGTLTFLRGATTPAAGSQFSAAVSSYVGDDDFFCIFGSTQTYQYWRLSITSIDASGFYIGRIGLWQSYYDFVGKGPQAGAGRTLAHAENVLRTKGGAEHRNDLGPLLRGLKGVLPVASSTIQTQIDSVIEHTKLNHKPFVTSLATGTTPYATTNRYGGCIHGRMNYDSLAEWEAAMLVAGHETLPINIIEVP